MEHKHSSDSIKTQLKSFSDFVFGRRWRKNKTLLGKEEEEEEETCLDLFEKIIACHLWHTVICNDQINFNLLQCNIKI